MTHIDTSDFFFLYKLMNNKLNFSELNTHNITATWIFSVDKMFLLHFC